MRFLYDNISVLAVAAICSVLAWMYGGTDSRILTPTMPWLVVLAIETALVFPQRHPGEGLVEARVRAWGRLKRDPLTWISLLLLVLLAIPLFNRGLCPCCDYPAIHFEGASEEPPFKFLPFCVNTKEHSNVLLWFACALPAMLATKHALLKRGKRLLVELLAWNGFALAALGMIQYAAGAPAPFWTDSLKLDGAFFSTFGYPNMGGDWFTTTFLFSCAAWRWHVECESETDHGRAKTNHSKFWRRHLFAVPALFSFVAAVMTLSRAAMVSCGSAALLVCIHSLACSFRKMSRSRRVKTVAAYFVAFALLGTFGWASFTGRGTTPAPKSAEEAAESAYDVRDDIMREMGSIDGRGMLDRVTGRMQYHAAVAMRVWRRFPVFGCGGWGYKHFSIPSMTDAEYAKGVQKLGGANVHNDWLQFLAEHGAAGLGLIAAIVLLLIRPTAKIWKALAAAARFMRGRDRPPRPVALFAFPGPAFCLVLAPFFTFVHAFGDCPLRSPAVLALFFVSFAAIDGYLPRIKNEDED